MHLTRARQVLPPLHPVFHLRAASGLPQSGVAAGSMAPRKKDKARAAARKHQRAGKDVLREIYDMCPKAGGEAGVTHDGKQMRVNSPKVFSLPESIGTLDGLHVLDLSKCPQLLELPDTIGGLKALTSLDLSDCTSLTKLPGTIGELGALTELSMFRCESLAALPSTIGELGALAELNLGGCSSLAALPATVDELKALTLLDLTACTSLVELPDAIGELGALTKLDLYGCSSLAALPDSIGKRSSPLTLKLRDCTSLVALPDTLVEPGSNVLVLGWNETTVTSTTFTRASAITVPGVTPATDADEAADEAMEDLHLMRRKRDEWAVWDQPEEEQKAEFDRKFLEEIKAKLSDAQMLYLRRLRRRVCDACGRQGTLEVERFPVCYCGARRYCDEECQRIDWLIGHSKTCASGQTFPPGPLGGLRESKKRASDSKESKECYERFRDLIFSQYPPPADRPR